MDYTSLVESILANEPLKRELEEISTRTRALNLVDIDWESRLRNHRIFQLHEDKSVKFSKYKDCANAKAQVKKILSPAEYFNVIIAGAFSLDTSDKTSTLGDFKKTSDISIVTRECAPLNLIAQSMAENKQQNLHDGCRLFVQTCQAIFCNTCVQLYKQSGQPIPKNNWCILMTRAFDGRHVTPRSRGIILRSLSGMNRFLAIFHVNISSFTSFGDNSYKIGGVIKEMVLFQESSLSPYKGFNFESLADVSVPGIECPSDDNDETVEEAIPTVKRQTQS
ncbi:hypothetical protein AVEN_212403-1 [Araneus ventricosus]|uniref:Uncharacterized protein n=1 Tax=Araneus ventricosus TaxID=182803 RepID=A0A4Y2VTE3_ARAVE|nr:hypothetical protein AVEN_212403-1 [Araneus ventricosus]